MAWEIGAPSTFCDNEQKAAASAAFIAYVDGAAEAGSVGQCKVQGEDDALVISANFPSTTSRKSVQAQFSGALDDLKLDCERDGLFSRFSSIDFECPL